jgi:hypothetical protein
VIWPHRLSVARMERIWVQICSTQASTDSEGFSEAIIRAAASVSRSVQVLDEDGMGEGEGEDNGILLPPHRRGP